MGRLSGRAPERGFAALAGTSVIRAYGYALMATYLSFYAAAFDATGLWIGAFTTAFALAQTATTVALGAWGSGDRVRRLLVWGALGSAATYVGFLFVVDEVTLVVARIAQGITISVLFVLGTAAVSTRASTDERGRHVGIFNQVGALAGGLGTASAGVIYEFAGFAPGYLLLAAASLGSAWLLRGTDLGVDGLDAGDGVNGYRQLVEQPAMRGLAAYRVGTGFAKTAVRVYLPIYAYLAVSLSGPQVGVVLTAPRLVRALCQGYTGTLADTIGRRPLLGVAALLYVGAAAIVPFTASFYPLIACALVFGVADACRVPASVALFTEIGTASRALTSLSLRSLLWKPGAVLAPLLAGVIHDYATIGLVFYATAAVMLVSVTVAAWLDTSQSVFGSTSLPQ
ncbi:major facilitator superfamily protein [Halovivax asiaticus JCM 14624]|uniref:Major facilitator superfamily protein n=1 Tax=Halovivax asiaticus JCM 14624 TaxID=1227490 RepID=M0BSL7_9EURY|nr:MFS transporter [Halovivax asiaticus]ELZ12684.1 major facilitator superfamily protein [Halovivax asiaticus JCM 14624]